MCIFAGNVNIHIKNNLITVIGRATSRVDVAGLRVIFDHRILKTCRTLWCKTKALSFIYLTFRLRLGVEQRQKKPMTESRCCTKSDVALNQHGG